MAYLDNNGVLYFWGKIKSWVQGQGYITSADVPEGAAASTTTPKMDGTAAVGSETAFARGDHVHPHDSEKVDKISGYGLAKIAAASSSDVQGTVFPTSWFTRVDEAQTASVGSYAVLLDIDGVTGLVTQVTNMLSGYALKSDISSMYKYKGSVATVSALPSSDNTTGDVYNVEASGMNYAWNGSEWDALGESFQITAITNAELDTICT